MLLLASPRRVDGTRVLPTTVLLLPWPSGPRELLHFGSHAAAGIRLHDAANESGGRPVALTVAAVTRLAHSRSRQSDGRALDSADDTAGAGDGRPSSAPQTGPWSLVLFSLVSSHFFPSGKRACALTVP